MNKKIKYNNKIHVRQGENVKVISGKHKGEMGRVKRVIRATNKVIIQGINLRVKHLKSKTQEETGSIKKIEFPIHISNVISLKE